MNRAGALLLGVGTASVAAAVLYVVLPAQRDTVRLSPDDAAIVAQGASVYRAHCASCHGRQLEGQPNWRERNADGLLPAPPHDASGHTWHHPDELLFRITKEGVAAIAGIAGYRSAMPPYAGLLGDADIVAALSYIQAQWPPEVRQRQREIDAQYLASKSR